MGYNLLVGLTQDGSTAPIRTSEKPGGHVQHTFPADPTDGSAIKAASQADVAALGTALAGILAELGGKLEPADLAALAAAARTARCAAGRAVLLAPAVRTCRILAP